MRSFAKGLEAKGLFSFKRRNNDAYMLMRRFRARENLMLTRDGLSKEVFEKRRGVLTMRGGLLSQHLETCGVFIYSGRAMGSFCS